MKGNLAPAAEVTHVGAHILKFNCFGLKSRSKVMLCLNPANSEAVERQQLCGAETHHIAFSASLYFSVTELIMHSTFKLQGHVTLLHILFMEPSNLHITVHGGAEWLLVVSRLLCSDWKKIWVLFKFPCDCVVFISACPLTRSFPFSLPFSFFQYLSMLITHKMKGKQEIRWEDEKSIRTGGGHHYAFAPSFWAGRPVTCYKINENQRGVCACVEFCPPSVFQDIRLT